RLLTERDQLTATAQGISDEAAKSNRDLTETETATLSGIAERCAKIDEQVQTYNAQAESTRAYAKLRAAISGTEADAEAGKAEHNGRAVQRRAPAQVERRDTGSWAAPFMRSGVLESYTGHGTSPRVDVGPVYETRTPPTPSPGDPITTDWP